VASVFAFESTLVLIAYLALLAVKIWALVDAATRPGEAYVAAGKLTKQGWLIILALTVVTALMFRSVLGIFSLVGTVAAFVYLLDVRPALSSITRR
jgi:hypothetical protein